MICGCIAALLFPFIGLASSYIGIVYKDEHERCIAWQGVYTPGFDDHLTEAVRWYSCWYYAYAIIYYFILFEPFEILYVFSGILMIICFAAGYALCFVNLAWLTQSKCKNNTAYGKLTTANTTIFLVISSFTLIMTHLLLLFEGIRKCCCKRQHAEKIGTDSNPSSANRNAVMDDTIAKQSLKSPGFDDS